MDDTPKNLSTKEIALEVVQLLSDLQLNDVVALDITKQCSWCDIVIIATYTSEVQAKSALQEVKQHLYACDLSIQSHSKAPQSRWFIVDAYNLVVNLFSQEERNFYQLETLWAKGIPLTDNSPIS